MEKVTGNWSPLSLEAPPGSDSSRTGCDMGLPWGPPAKGRSSAQHSVKGGEGGGVILRPSFDGKALWMKWQQWYIMNIQNAMRPTERLCSVLNEFFYGMVTDSKACLSIKNTENIALSGDGICVQVYWGIYLAIMNAHIQTLQGH